MATSAYFDNTPQTITLFNATSYQYLLNQQQFSIENFTSQIAYKYNSIALTTYFVIGHTLYSLTSNSRSSIELGTIKWDKLVINPIDENRIELYYTNEKDVNCAIVSNMAVISTHKCLTLPTAATFLDIISKRALVVGLDRSILHIYPMNVLEHDSGSIQMIANMIEYLNVLSFVQSNLMKENNNSVINANSNYNHVSHKYCNLFQAFYIDEISIFSFALISNKNSIAACCGNNHLWYIDTIQGSAQMHEIQKSAKILSLQSNDCILCCSLDNSSLVVYSITTFSTLYIINGLPSALTSIYFHTSQQQTSVTYTKNKIYSLLDIAICLCNGYIYTLTLCNSAQHNNAYNIDFLNACNKSIRVTANGIIQSYIRGAVILYCTMNGNLMIFNNESESIATNVDTDVHALIENILNEKPVEVVKHTYQALQKSADAPKNTYSAIQTSIAPITINTKIQHPIQKPFESIAEEVVHKPAKSNNVISKKKKDLDQVVEPSTKNIIEESVQNSLITDGAKFTLGSYDYQIDNEKYSMPQELISEVAQMNLLKAKKKKAKRKVKLPKIKDEEKIKIETKAENNQKIENENEVPASERVKNHSLYKTIKAQSEKKLCSVLVLNKSLHENSAEQSGIDEAQNNAVIGALAEQKSISLIDHNPMSEMNSIIISRKTSEVSSINSKPFNNISEIKQNDTTKLSEKDSVIENILNAGIPSGYSSKMLKNSISERILSLKQQIYPEIYRKLEINKKYSLISKSHGKSSISPNKNFTLKEINPQLIKKREMMHKYSNLIKDKRKIDVSMISSQDLSKTISKLKCELNPTLNKRKDLMKKYSSINDSLKLNKTAVEPETPSYLDDDDDDKLLMRSRNQLAGYEYENMSNNSSFQRYSTIAKQKSDRQQYKKVRLIMDQLENKLLLPNIKDTFKTNTTTITFTSMLNPHKPKLKMNSERSASHIRQEFDGNFSIKRLSKEIKGYEPDDLVKRHKQIVNYLHHRHPQQFSKLHPYVKIDQKD